MTQRGTIGLALLVVVILLLESHAYNLRQEKKRARDLEGVIMPIGINVVVKVRAGVEEGVNGIHSSCSLLILDISQQRHIAEQLRILRSKPSNGGDTKYSKSYKKKKKKSSSKSKKEKQSKSPKGAKSNGGGLSMPSSLSDSDESSDPKDSDSSDDRDSVDDEKDPDDPPAGGSTEFDFSDCDTYSNDW